MKNKTWNISGNDVDVQKLVDSSGGVDIEVGGPTKADVESLIEDAKLEIRPYVELIDQLFKRCRNEESEGLFTPEGELVSQSWLNQTFENERLDKELLASIEKKLLNRLIVRFGVVV